MLSLRPRIIFFLNCNTFLESAVHKESNALVHSYMAIVKKIKNKVLVMQSNSGPELFVARNCAWMDSGWAVTAVAV